MSLDSGSTVALCGVDDQYNLLSFFSFLRVVSWSPNISALVVGDDAEGRWKYNEALRLGIRCVLMDDVLAQARTGAALWVNMYAPKSLGDLIGQGTVVAELQTWLKGWVAGKGALVTGPPGIGKTTAVHLVIAACGYDIVEFNASDERSASAVRRYFDEARRSGHCGRRRVVVMDEVDGMSRGDRGGIGELAKVISSCVFPIICIANERGTPRLRPLAACCTDIRFSRPTKNMIAKSLLTRIVKPRSLSYSVSDLEGLCERNGNDIRSIINALQFAGSFETGCKDELQRLDAFSASGRLIGGSDSWGVKENLVYLDYGMVPLMVAEGYVAACDRPRPGVGGDEMTRLERCVSASVYMGDYDIVDRRIHSSQAWSIMPYAVSGVVSAVTAAKGVAPFNIFPSWLGKQSKRLKHRRWVHGMRMRLGCGNEDMLDRMDTLRSLLFRKGCDVGVIVQDLVSFGLTRDDMLDTLVDLTYKDDVERVNLDTKLKSAITREWKKVASETVQLSSVSDEDCGVESDNEEIEEYL